MTIPLLYPYTYDERRPTFIHPVLFVPEFFTETTLEAHTRFLSEEWTSALNHPKIIMELCSGSGEWIVNRALKDSEALYIAVEVRMDRASKIHKRLHMQKVDNCLIVLGMAEDFVRYYLYEGIVSEVYINFPDPWPKRKHAKNRLFKQSFLSDLKRILIPGGNVTFVTDDHPYLLEGIEAMQSEGFIPKNPEPYFLPLDKGYGYSFFQHLWAKKAKKNHKTEFFKPLC